MLTRPDRLTFEQIRARWEAVQSNQVESVEMVGRKVSQQPVSGEAHDSAGSKFRRKISHGLATLSNTLSARKTTPGRLPVIHPQLAVTAPPGPSTFPRHCDAPLSPTSKPRSISKRSPGLPPRTAEPATHDSSTKRDDPDATPKALPRSRTTSFLPRPVRLDADATVTELERAAKPFPFPFVADSKLRVMPSKIPTPSPPLSERRVYSPRQHISQYTTTQEKGAKATSGYAVVNADSPLKTVAKSRTTSNLVKTTRSPQPANFMAPRRPGMKRPVTSPPVQKPTLQENVPTSKRVNQRHTQMQEKIARRETMAVPITVTPRRSFMPASPLSQPTQSNRSTPLTARKRVGSNLAPQTPVSARRAQPNEQVVANAQQSVPVVSSGSIVRPRLMGPRNPPTPTPLNAEAAGTGVRPMLPRSNTDKDIQRKTLGTPNGLGGVWRSSRALAAANHEVRLPRSSTFHNFGRSWEAAPPVPPIPDQYRTPSLPHLFQASIVQPVNSYKSQYLRKISDTTPCESIPEEGGVELSVLGSTTATQIERTPSSALESSDSSNDLASLFPLPRDARSTPAPLSNHSRSSQTSLLGSQQERPWSISRLHFEHSADIEPHLQVRDYMPPLYWAGRFQSRYDQWRTEAMHAELNPQHRIQGQLGQCRLAQEKIAACYIFAQLRDLCLTGQAADSLWAFESTYRKDNQLLGNPNYPMPPPRKHDDQGTQKGAFGRAVRKLTPRKSSFVNLLKGKGWGKGDEVKPPDVPCQSLETSSGGS